MPPHLVLLTAHPELPSPQRILESGRRMGWRVEARRPAPWWAAAGEGEAPPRAAFLTRTGVFTWREILREHRRWRAAGAWALQSRRALVRSSDQWATLCDARSAGLAIPTTRRIGHPGQLEAALEDLPGPSWYIKGRRGSKGSHVMLARTRAELRDQVAFLWGQGESPLVQEDARDRGPVRRHWVFGDRVVASVESEAAAGEHRSNAHRGGRLRAVEASAVEAALAVGATRAVGLPFAGVDLIGTGQPLLLEVNAAPGLSGIEAATGRDLAGELLELLAPRLGADPATP